MNVRDTLQDMIFNYPTLFQDSIWKCGCQLFTIIGNGYEWRKGELVGRHYDYEKNKWYSKIAPSTKYSPEAKGDIENYFPKYKQKIFELVEADIGILLDSLDHSNGIVVDEFGYYELDPCIEYAKFFKVPKNVSDDWLAFLIKFGRTWVRSLGMENPKRKLITDQISLLRGIQQKRTKNNDQS